MDELTSDELKEKVLHYLETAGRMKRRGVAKSIGVEKKLVDKAIDELANEGKIEYQYLDTTYIKLPDK